MTLMLAKNEVIIKRFDYTTRKIKNSKRSLIVTNKRVISEIMDRNSVIRKEIPVSEAEYLSTSYANTKPSLIASILFLILAIVAGIVGWKVDLPVLYMNYALYGFAGLFLLLAIIFLVKFFKNKAASVEITISGKKMETQVFSLGSSNMSSKSKAKDLKIQVDRSQSIAMVNELGAVLIDVRNQSLDELLGGLKEENKPKEAEIEEEKADVYVEAPVAEEQEALEETPIEENTLEEAPVEEEAPALEEAPVLEESPVEEETPAEEKTSNEVPEEVLEEVPAEEEQQTGEITTEEKTSNEVSEEETPVLEEQETEETVPFEEEVVEESSEDIPEEEQRHKKHHRRR